MTRQELMDLIAAGENSGVEFKRDDVRPEQLAREVVALANFRGGVLLLGVEDDGAVTGITRPDAETWIMDTVLARYVHPQILPWYEEVPFPDGRRVAVLRIGEGTAKPHVLRHGDREDIYIRVGSTSRRATREQQARLFDSGGLLHAELLPVSGTSLADLDRDRVEDYLGAIVGEDILPSTQDAWHERLCGLGFMVEQGREAPSCSIAGLVLFGRSPRRALRQAGVRWMSFPGKEMDLQARDDTTLDGPLVALGRGADASRRHVEDGLVERLLDRMRPFVSHDASSLADDLRRERVWRYPVAALREAIVNAFVHRDWTRALEVEVVDYADRLEVTSPGPLPNSMTVARVLAGQRTPRNPILVEVMRDYGYVDARGMGVRRRIVPAVVAHSGREPLLVEEEDRFRIVLPAGGA